MRVRGSEALEWPLREHYTDRHEAALELVAGALRGDRLTNADLVARLEREIVSLTGARCCVAVSSATAGLMLAIRALTRGRGGAVLVPCFAFGAALLAPLWAGRRVIALPVDPGHFNLCAKAVTSALASHEVAAVLAIGVAGNPSGLAAVAEVTRDARVPLVVDAAACLGAVGVIGGATVISMSARKALPAGEGGLVLVDSPALDDSLRRLRQYGSRDGFFCVEQGLNARLSEVHAAVALAYLGDLLATLDKRISFACELRAALAAQAEVAVQAVDAAARPAWNDVVVRVPAATRDELVGALRALGIEAVPFYSPPAHEHPAFRDAVTVDLQGREDEQAALAGETVGIPVLAGLGERHREAIVSVFARLC